MMSYNTMFGEILRGIVSRDFKLVAHDYCSDSRDNCRSEAVLIEADEKVWLNAVDGVVWASKKSGDKIYPLLHLSTTFFDTGAKDVELDILGEYHDKEFAKKMFLERINMKP